MATKMRRMAWSVEVEIRARGGVAGLLKRPVGKPDR
jgi:hypothetical protein